MWIFWDGGCQTFGSITKKKICFYWKSITYLMDYQLLYIFWRGLYFVPAFSVYIRGASDISLFHESFKRSLNWYCFFLGKTESVENWSVVSGRGRWGTSLESLTFCVISIRNCSISSKWWTVAKFLLDIPIQCGWLVWPQISVGIILLIALLWISVIWGIE